MKTLRSKCHAPRKLKSPPRRRTTGEGNNNMDAYPHDAISNPESRLHREDGQPTRRPL